MRYHTMLQYFGFYLPLADATAEAREAPEAPEAPEANEPFVARAVRLGDRHRHTPCAVPTGRAWEPSHER